MVETEPSLAHSESGAKPLEHKMDFHITNQDAINAFFHVTKAMPDHEQEVYLLKHEQESHQLKTPVPPSIDSTKPLLPPPGEDVEMLNMQSNVHQHIEKFNQGGVGLDSANANATDDEAEPALETINSTTVALQENSKGEATYCHQETQTTSFSLQGQTSEVNGDKNKNLMTNTIEVQTEPMTFRNLYSKIMSDAKFESDYKRGVSAGSFHIHTFSYHS